MKPRKRLTALLLSLCMLMALCLSACGGPAENDTPPDILDPGTQATEKTDKGTRDPEPNPEPVQGDVETVDIPSDGGANVEAAFVDVTPLGEELNIDEEAVALAGSPVAMPTILTPTHPGTSQQSNAKATVDYSNVQDGYVMACFTASTDKKLKCQVTGPSTTYTYNLTQGEWDAFPLSDGNGSYKITVFENTTGSKYATVVSASASVSLSDEFEPFIRPNQYVDYQNATNTVNKAAELIGAETDVLKKVQIVYDFVVNSMTYDKAKASSVQSGYLPDLDAVLASKTGICFDYAALMAGMLRSQGVPCKLVVGYAGTAYHAWISVWSDETGWIENAVYFDGTSWQRMDPTFASSGKSSESIMKYIGDGSNYNAKYFY